MALSNYVNRRKRLMTKLAFPVYSRDGGQTVLAEFSSARYCARVLPFRPSS